jgi:glutathione S-transferase
VLLRQVARAPAQLAQRIPVQLHLPRPVASPSAEAPRRLAVVDDLLRDRTGDFILGENFSYAECIAAPWIQRCYVTLPYFRGIDFEDDILSRFDFMSTWMRAVCDRPSCVTSRCPESEMIAACKRYYVSFVSPGATGTLYLHILHV